MGRRTWAIIAAVLLAAAAAALVWWYAGSVRTETTKQEETQTVLFAAENIPAQTTGEAAVENRLVQQQQIPKRYVAPGAVADETALQGQVFSQAVTKGQQVVSGQLGNPEAQGLAFGIEKGMRAVSIPMDRVTGVGGTVRAGDRVDVIATFDAALLSEAGLTLGDVLAPAERDRLKTQVGKVVGGTAATVTRILLPQVKVLQADPVDDSSQSGGLGSGGDELAPNNPVFVLMVTPADAERLVFAQQKGEIWFALVPAEDTDVVITTGSAIPNAFVR